MNALILVATRRCTQRCVYCPVVKTGWPDMTAARAIEALQWFAEQGGDTVKLFGGEPLLNPEVVRTVVDHVAVDSRLSSVTLSTNGILLDDSWLAYLASRPKTSLALSLDGLPADHARNRPSASGCGNGLENLNRIMPRLIAFPRLVVTQVIAPDAAASASAGFHYLLKLGFRHFNVMPASYVQWSSMQLEALRCAFRDIANIIRTEWKEGRPLYLRNLFVRNPQPIFATAAVVDADHAMFPSDCVLANLPDADRSLLRCGSASEPPEPGVLEERAAAVPAVLARFWPETILRSTARADAVLHELWRSLVPDYLRRERKHRNQSRASSRIH